MTSHAMAAAPETPQAPPRAPSKNWALRALDSRYAPPALISCILLVGQLTFGILESYPKTLLAILSAIACEFALGRMFTGKWPHPASAYISGISVGILVRSPAFWPYMLCSLI